MKTHNGVFWVTRALMYARDPVSTSELRIIIQRIGGPEIAIRTLQQTINVIDKLNGNWLKRSFKRSAHTGRVNYAFFMRRIGE